MTIDEAIKTLAFESKYPGNLPVSQREDAIKLGLEALKLIRIHRGNPIGVKFKLLPGETED